MKKIVLAPIALSLMLAGCSQPQTEQAQPAVKAEQATVKVEKTAKAMDQNNPFFQPFDTEFGLAPFAKIKDEHFLPAFDQGIKENLNDFEVIANSTDKPTFANTIEGLEFSGSLLTKVANVFYNLTGANTNETIQKVNAEVSPKLSALNDDMVLNDKLFQRVKAVFDSKDSLKLNTAQNKLLTDTYRAFVRGGANLNESQKTTLRDLNGQLSTLAITFGDNLLAETNDFKLVVDNKKDLAGLPDGVIAAAAATAKKNGADGKWVFTTQRPSFTPFMTYAQNRDLRRQMHNAYAMRGNNDNANDNKKVLSKMASLRVQRAQLLGYKSHAHYTLERNTAKNPQNVFGLLNKIWPAAIKRANSEIVDMQAMIDQQGGGFKLEDSDWWYYADKIRKAKYNLDEEMTRPYFSLENTIKGVFYATEKLYGLTFKERTDITTYHEDVRTFEVYDRDGSMMGLYLADFYIRDSKRGGAWMNSFRKQSKAQGTIKPIIVNVLNYPRPTEDQPTLLTFDQASTLFHEFGHTLHGLLSDGYYNSQTGTATPRDFVEFPSQVMENWLFEPEVLAQFAKHYKTGEVIPQDIVTKIQQAAQFNQGFFTTEYMGAALLDMSWHSLTDPTEITDVNAFEVEAMKKAGLISEIIPRYRSTYFSHIFAGGYSSGYYAYIWSEIMAADAYAAFKENGIFDRKTADAFRNSILSQGGTDDPITLYKRFRGREAKIAPLLEQRGLNAK
jgi:peptidyl-dipeptidase Dcp